MDLGWGFGLGLDNFSKKVYLVVSLLIIYHNNPIRSRTWDSLLAPTEAQGVKMCVRLFGTLCSREFLMSSRESRKAPEKAQEGNQKSAQERAQPQERDKER